MSQSDQTVQNATFPAVRADINDNLAALFSQSSGPSAPAVTVAYQPWIDTSSSPAVWKIRNGTNSGWVTIGNIDVGVNGFSVGGVTPIASGGTGQTTASSAINALLPSQTGNANKVLQTDGTVVSWVPATASQRFYYDASNTWNKPTTGVVALVTIWGGGGGGGQATLAGCGGGGGACVQKLFYLSDLPSTVVITIGAGGVGRSTQGSGNAGATTTFGALLSAFGGGGGGNTTTGTPVSGGGGGGSKAVGTNGNSGGAGGAGHGLSMTGDSANAGAISVGGIFGGGAGGSSPSGGGTAFVGGSSQWGGAGGGSRTSGTTASNGGTSLQGGDGGAGGATNASNGSLPGGGGGGCTSGTSGSGAAGLCVIYVW